MKRILRVFLIHIAAIYLATQIASGMTFANYAEGVVTTGLALGLASFTIKPVVKILIMPLTLATMGVFRFIANVVTLYVVDLAVDQFSIQSFNYPGFNSQYFDIPALSYTSLWAYLAYAVLIAIIITVINWLRK